MSRKQTAPLKLKRPDNYVIEYPQDYVPPKPKLEKPKKIEAPKKQKPQKPQRIARIARPPISKPVDQKRKYFLPGQKYPTPEEDQGLRIFYESLLAQKPESEIALRYCLQHGLLEKDVAELIAKNDKMQRSKRIGSH